MVDDDARSRELVAAMLSSRYHVLLAHDVPSAVQQVKLHPVDLVVLDVMMPVISGIDGCKMIKAERRDWLPVLLLTALDEQSDRNLGLAAGADDFLTKPVDRRELELRVGLFLKLKRQDRQLNDQLADLNQLASVKDDLVNLLVHDLRTPLTALMMVLRMLEMTATDEASKETLQLGREAGARLTQLVEELLEVRLLEEGKLTLKLEPINAREVMQEAVDAVQPVALDRKVKLVVEDSSDVMLSLDRKLVRRAIENLLSNAVKYTKGQVDVGLSSGSDSAEVTVADRGPGIPAAYRANLFEKFGSVEAEKGNQRRGIGLGLYMVRLVASAHSGQVLVEDREGGGARFRLQLGPWGPVVG
ncbi:MAG: response regulator [Myxococcaceae bacterium]